MRKALLLLLLTFISVWISEPVFSQVDEKSTMIGNPGDNESAGNIVADLSGNTYVAGKQNNKGLIVKQNAAHATLWSKALSFTTNTGSHTTITFLDIIGDTLIGCGILGQTGINTGSFYFKMNAQTGAMYWVRHESVSTSALWCMRYANGKYFLVGYARNLPDFSGKVLAVSSQTGNVIWETPLLHYWLPNPSSTTNHVLFVNATEVVNGKLFITGSADNTIGSKVPVIVGITETGTVFFEKYLDIPVPTGNFKSRGTKIHFDANGDLVIGIDSDYTNFYGDLFLLKMDPLGNILFCKNYNVDNYAIGSIAALNETASSYVLFGTNWGAVDGTYTLKIDKNGNVEKCVGISKPNVYTGTAIGLSGRAFGNSMFLNGNHYFVNTETTYSPIMDDDINQVILDEELTVIEDCSRLSELVVIAMDVSVSLQSPIISHIPNVLSFQAGGILEDLSFGSYCDSISLDLVQNTGCSQAILQANVAGFTSPTFYWSTGDTTVLNTLSVATSDTVFLRVLDTKCCELFDTIVPVIVPSAFAMNLPNDTTICLQPGNTYTINPVFSGANGAVQYLWSDSSTGPSLNVTQSGTYWLELSDSCLTLRDSIVVTVNSLPVIGNTANITVCEDDFPVTLSPAVSAGASVLWDDGTATVNRTVNGPGSYTISATNNCGTVNATIVVSQTDLPDAQLASLIDTCIQNGNSIVLVPVLTNTTSILWSDGSSGSQLTVSSSGSYTVYASNGCGADSATASVTINYFPELDLPATLDTCFDVGTGFSYTAPGSGGSYQWSSGSQSAAEWITQEGTYSCTLTNVCGSITDSMHVRRLTAVDLYFPEDSILECAKQLAVSNLQIETNYGLEIFSPDGDLAGINLSESGWYAVHAFNTCGEVWDSIFVNLQNEQFFYLPNSFTPNGDLNNDRFEFQGENIVVRDIRIFNRWGEEIFTENGTFTGWDGTYRGEVCPVGIYAVHVIYEDCFGIPAEFNGHVNLIR